jgi:hypothetical protein
MTKCLQQADYMKLTAFYFVKRLLITYLASNFGYVTILDRVIKT